MNWSKTQYIGVYNITKSSLKLFSLNCCEFSWPVLDRGCDVTGGCDVAGVVM